MVTAMSEQLTKISHLVLARLLIAGANGDTTAKIKKDLEPLFVDRWSGLVLVEQLQRSLADLESNGLITTSRGKNKQSRTEDRPYRKWPSTWARVLGDCSASTEDDMDKAQEGIPYCASPGISCIH